MAFFVTAAFGLTALGLFDVSRSGQALGRIHAQAWLLVVASFLLIAIIRAFRLLFIAPSAQVAPVFRASFLHGIANAVLPARMGEAVLPLALSKFAKLDLFRAIGLLLVVRLGDLIALTGLGLILVGLLDYANLADSLRIAAVVCGIVLISAIAVIPALVGVAGGLLPRLFKSLADRISTSSAQINAGNKAYLVLLTLAIWFTLAVASHISIRAAGLEVDFAVAWLACIAASFAFALPVNGIASVGPFEAAFVSVLVLSGADAQAALTAALHLHICALLAAGLAALSTVLFKAVPVTRNEFG
nr:lysylphosphatidylglycerol synthase domain-containing protein [Hoeflea prorocentri]